MKNLLGSGRVKCQTNCLSPGPLESRASAGIQGQALFGGGRGSRPRTVRVGRKERTEGRSKGGKKTAHCVGHCPTARSHGGSRGRCVCSARTNCTSEGSVKGKKSGGTSSQLPHMCSFPLVQVCGDLTGPPHGMIWPLGRHRGSPRLQAAVWPAFHVSQAGAAPEG